MNYQIVWSKTAIADLHDLVRFIAADDRDTAIRFGERILTKVESLTSFPRVGRIVPECHDDLIREIILTPYRVIYEVDDKRAILSVLRIWHGARGEPEVLNELRSTIKGVLLLSKAEPATTPLIEQARRSQRSAVSMR